MSQILSFPSPFPAPTTPCFFLLFLVPVFPLPVCPSISSLPHGSFHMLPISMLPLFPSSHLSPPPTPSGLCSLGHVLDGCHGPFWGWTDRHLPKAAESLQHHQHDLPYGEGILRAGGGDYRRQSHLWLRERRGRSQRGPRTPRAELHSGSYDTWRGDGSLQEPCFC